jgi:3-hydroxybutyryl-CoA dehydrogenase
MATALEPSRLVAVVGSGAMGAGIAQIAAVAGHPVLLFEVRPGAALTAVGDILKTLGKLAE